MSRPSFGTLALAGALCAGIALAALGIYRAGDVHATTREGLKSAQAAQKLTKQLDLARQQREADKAAQEKDRERVASESFKYSEHLRADADGARTALERLRVATAQALARGRAPQQGASAPGGRSPAETFAELFGTCAAELRQMGEDADRDHAAGLKCERTYDTLTVNQDKESAQ